MRQPWMPRGLIWTAGQASGMIAANHGYAPTHLLQRMRKTPALLVCAALLCGCRTFEPPAVSLVNARFTQATVFETTAEFTLRLNNATPEPMILDGAAHKIYLNGLYVGDGLSNQPLELPRLTSGTQDVTVHLSNLMLATRFKPIIESQSFDYRIQSVFYGRQPSGRARAVSEGRLDLRDFQPTPR